MNRIIPDIINCKPKENFTQIRNDVLRDPNISLKSKGLLALLLSNKDGWYSFAETIKNFSSDGDTSIRSALKELENNQYLIRLRYRDKDSKTIRGGFWAYTDIPGDFNLEETMEILEKNNFEVVPRNTEKSTNGFCTRTKAKTNNTKYKNTNYTKKNPVSGDSIPKENSLSTEEENYIKLIDEQIKELVTIPYIIENTSKSFIRDLSLYKPTKKEISHFIKYYDKSLLEYYKEYIIYSVLEEFLYKPNSNEFVIPRIALLNSNSVRRSHLDYAKENSEDILYSLKLIDNNKEEEHMDEKTKKEFTKNKKSFNEFLKEQPSIKETREEEDNFPEIDFVKNLHKLDKKNFDYIPDDQIDSFIEDILLEE